MTGYIKSIGSSCQSYATTYAKQTITSTKDTVVSTASETKKSVVNRTVGFGKFIVGLNNLSNARNALSGSVSVSVKEEDGVVKVKAHNPGYLERISSACSQLTVGGAKVTGLGMIAYGSACKGAVALNLVEPCSTFSLGGASVGLSNIATNVITTGASLATNLTPVITTAAGVVGTGVLQALNVASNHKLVTLAVAVASIPLYSAYQDISEMNEGPKIKEGEKTVVIIKSAKSVGERSILLGKAIGKVAVAGGILALSTYI